MISHRLVLGFDAVADGVDPRAVVAAVLAAVPVLQVAPSQVDTEVVPVGHAGRS